METLALEAEKELELNLRPLLIGLVAGQRSMTPLAAVALAARSGGLARDNGAPAAISKRSAAIAASTLAIGEMIGDKMRSAPDRTVPPGLAARLLTGGIAGAALAPRSSRASAAALGAAGAILGGYAGLALRKRAMRRFGQARSGLAEDLLSMAATTLILRAGPKRQGRSVRQEGDA